MQSVQTLDGLVVDSQSEVPLYAQIVEHVQSGVAAGHLQAGQQLPPVRLLARRLGVNHGTVAKAYCELEREGVIATHRGGGSYVAAMGGSRRFAAMREARLEAIVKKAALDALSLGYSPQQAEAAFVLHMSRWRQEREESERDAAITPLAERQDTIILTGSHDLMLHVLASHLSKTHPEIDLSIKNVGSLGGLIALERDEAHIAGAHLLDEETGEYNVAFVKRILPGQEVVLVTLAHRLQGFIVAGGNPKGIKGLDDLRRREVRFINRQRGSGTRVLLDYKLRQVGIAPQEVHGYDREVDTHTAVAAAVASGTADVGLGIYGAARSFGLDFLPLLKERYDLVIPLRYHESQLLKPLLGVLSDREFKGVVIALGGYDTADTGKISFLD